MVSLHFELGRNLCNPLRCEGLLFDKTAASLQFGKITLHFPKLQGETGWLRTASTASQSRVFRLSLETQRTIRNKPGIAPPIGGVSLLCDLRERVSGEESHFLTGLSLVANFGGHTSRVADGPRDQRSIMMCVELRISQPPSRGFSRSLQSLAKESQKIPEICHKLIAVLPKECTER